MPVAFAARDRPVARSPEVESVIDRRPLHVVTTLYDFAPGGVERIAARLHDAWLSANLRSEMLVADVRTAPPLPLAEVVCAGSRSRRRGPVAFALLLRALCRRLRLDPPDVLFCAGNTYAVVLVALRILVGPSCPPIVAKISNCLVRQDMSPFVRWWYHRWLRMQGRWIDHFVGLAPAMRDEIAYFTGAADDRISIIEDPVLTADDMLRLAEARDTTVRETGARHYLAVGRLARQKNFTMLLDAFARIALPDDRLTILGEGTERTLLETRARTLGIADRVLFAGHVDPIETWLARADALILSSDYEGVPAVLVEALAAGIPIVSTRCCVSMDDLLGHGCFGRIVPVGDSIALADAMAAAVLPEPAGVVEARRAAAERYTIDRASRAYTALMNRLAAARAVGCAGEATGVIASIAAVAPV